MISVFTETWLNSNVLNTEILSPKYNIIRCDRKFAEINKRKRRGVKNFQYEHFLCNSTKIYQFKIILPCCTIVYFRQTGHF